MSRTSTAFAIIATSFGGGLLSAQLLHTNQCLCDCSGSDQSSWWVKDMMGLRGDDDGDDECDSVCSQSCGIFLVVTLALLFVALAVRCLLSFLRYRACCYYRDSLFIGTPSIPCVLLVLRYFFLCGLPKNMLLTITV